MGIICNFVTALILLQFQSYYSFNLDLNFVDVISGDSKNNYFGYSVLLQKGISSSIILVGAPRSNSSYPNHSNIKEPGVLYRCDIGIPHSCKQFVIDPEGNSEHKGGDNRFEYKNRKDGGLLGAAIDGGGNVGDSFVVCSPRWSNDRIDKSEQLYLTNGMCYRLQDSKNLNEVGEKLMPLLDKGKQGLRNNYYYLYGEVGMSVQYLNKKKELLLGAPGVLTWKGTVVRYKDLDLITLPPSQRLIQHRTKRQTNIKYNVPNPAHISSLKENNSYFGYAMSSGKFKSNNSEQWYVAGAPRAEKLNGLVLLYQFPSKDNNDLIIRAKMVGDQLGSYFGAAVLSVDVTSNGAADLLVGAPTYVTEAWDEGCVYFYKNDGQGNFEKPLKLFGNKEAGARFGTSISSLGDVNQDSYRDVAIAAPYEDGQGAVYIYLGGRNGLTVAFSQKIYAKKIDTLLRGFGFSISKGVDIDQNLYNDMAIGAYKSDQVAIVKSRPVIKYFANLTTTVRELSVNTTNFVVKYCINYTSPTSNVIRVDTNIQIIKDSRTVIKPNVERTVTITKDNAYCGNIDIALKGDIFDYTMPLTMEMIYRISDDEKKEFCPLCPITDPTDSKSVILNIPVANGCGDDSICQPILKIFANFENNTNSLVIGSLTSLKLNVRVENKGEPAYLCQIYTKLPSDVEIVRISNKCVLGEDKIYQCLVDNVLQPNTSRELVLDFDLHKLNPQSKELFFNLTVDSKGQEVNVTDNSLPITLPLRLENNMEIAGKSLPDQIVYVDEQNEVKSEIVNFSHEFSIKNLGPSPLPQIVITFDIPIELKDFTTKNIALDVYEPEVYKDNQKIRCTTDYSSGFFTDKSEREGGGKSNIDEDKIEASLSRSKRNSDFGHFEQLDSAEPLFDLPVNRTTFFNCSSGGVKCMQVTCTSGAMMTKNEDVKAKFSIRAHIDVLQQLLGNKDLILISSVAETNINGKITKRSVQTVLIGSLTKQEASYWIYIGGVVGSLVILAVLIFVLYKCNFFSRPDREKLQNEAENLSEDDNFKDYKDDCDESEELK